MQGADVVRQRLAQLGEPQVVRIEGLALGDRSLTLDVTGPEGTAALLAELLVSPLAA